MKVKDFITMEVDVDVYDDVCEACAIAFCGPLQLTNRGRKYWSNILDRDIELLSDNVTAIVHASDENDAEEIAAFFESAAGFCSCEQYERWFDDIA